MKDWQKRVIEEHSALMEKITKLGDFLNSGDQSVVSEAEIGLLWSQYHAMCVYRDILCMRVASWGGK